VATCTCNVTCFTDYIDSLSCSCSDALTSSSYVLVAACMTDDEEISRAQCEMQAPQHWCDMTVEWSYLTSLQKCHCTLSQDYLPVPVNNWPVSHLCDLFVFAVKPQPPFNVQLLGNENAYNLSWEMVYTPEENYYLNSELQYEVQIGEKEAPPEEQRNYPITDDTRYLSIPDAVLKKGKNYVARVRAQVRPHTYSGSWSEWSPTVEWKTKSEEVDQYKFYGFLSLILVPFVLLCYVGKILQKKPYLHSYIPSPEDFFKPLYVKYDGDFKKWVGPISTLPVFDLEKDTVVAVVSDKQGSLEKLCKMEAKDSSKDSKGGRGKGDTSFVSVSTGDCSKLYFPGASGQLTDKSTGHISIDTVTVWGEEEQDYPDNTLGGEDPYRGCQGSHNCFDYPACGLDGPSSPEQEGLLGSATRSSANLPAQVRLYNLYGSRVWPLEAGDNELESLSLDSYASNDRSEDDGYPRVGLDLDTIDSGFAESDCSSPVQSDFTDKDQINSAVLNDQEHCTNYVKQWVAYTSTASGEGCSSS
ncbi:IL21R protein, partial [Atractosteus spatula]|nr:IL21R protein [Atractosteus spatula]